MKPGSCLFCCLLIAWAQFAGAQSYRSKPIRVYVGFAAGSTTDLIGRMLAQKMSETLGQRGRTPGDNRRPDRPDRALFRGHGRGGDWHNARTGERLSQKRDRQVCERRKGDWAEVGVRGAVSLRFDAVAAPDGNGMTMRNARDRLLVLARP
jgi:hypothetical protein